MPVLSKHQKFKAFNCHNGVFKYKVIPFSLQNAPAVFQKMINQVLVDLLGSCFVSYMYEILLFSKDRNQHTTDIKHVLNALASSDLLLKPSKCELYQEEVAFLGKFILRNGHNIFPDNIKAILDFDTSRSTTEVRGFLGSVNFLCRFFKDISQRVAPLTSFTGDVPFI